MNSNKKQSNVGEEMVIYSQGTCSIYEHSRSTLSVRTHQPPRVITGRGKRQVLVSPAQNDDWSGGLRGRSNQDGT